MPTIKEVKKELRHREWAEQIAECQNSGMKVKDWCREKGVSSNTYYRHLRIVRTELLEKAEGSMQKIVPVSLSAELSDTAIPVASPPTKSDFSTKKIVMRKDGIEIELPQSISEDTLLVLLRGLKQC